jgi:hypothetical protein
MLSGDETRAVEMKEADRVRNWRYCKFDKKKSVDGHITLWSASEVGPEEWEISCT